MDIIIGCINGPLCPLATVLSYIAIHNTTGGTFFKFPDGQPLIKSHFVAKVRNTLRQTPDAIWALYGIPPKHRYWHKDCWPSMYAVVMLIVAFQQEYLIYPKVDCQYRECYYVMK